MRAALGVLGAGVMGAAMLAAAGPAMAAQEARLSIGGTSAPPDGSLQAPAGSTVDGSVILAVSGGSERVQFTVTAFGGQVTLVNPDRLECSSSGQAVVSFTCSSPGGGQGILPDGTYQVDFSYDVPQDLGDTFLVQLDMLRNSPPSQARVAVEPVAAPTDAPTSASPSSPLMTSAPPTSPEPAPPATTPSETTAPATTPPATTPSATTAPATTPPATTPSATTAPATTAPATTAPATSAPATDTAAPTETAVPVDFSPPDEADDPADPAVELPTAVPAGEGPGGGRNGAPVGGMLLAGAGLAAATAWVRRPRGRHEG